MRRRAISHLSCLKVGDRFYFAKDNKKKVWQVSEHGYAYYIGRRTKISRCVDDNQTEQIFKSIRVIIFLRSIETII